MNAPVRSRPGRLAQQASLELLSKSKKERDMQSSPDGLKRWREEVAEKKGPGEGKTTRSGDGRNRENRGYGTSKSEPGGPGKPSLGTLCLSAAACQPQLFSLKHTEEKNKRIGNEPQGNKAEFSKSIK